MSEQAQQSIGSYTIDREIGRGGMGVVYLGHDTRLDRAVAIKALPEFLAQDPDRLARFEREAKTLAQLNHPNVAGIYGVEETDGATFLILEFVEGESLAERLNRGPLPVVESLKIAEQIAAGVEAAHDAGVIHRDLKPANVIVTADDRVKVLDFGLAKTTSQPSSSGSHESQAPTLTTPTSPASPTSPGAILGTAPYMSPEQARGRPVDKRTDVWSFGVLLYELLTGACPFRGETTSDCIGAILRDDVDFTAIPQETPAPARRALRRCLQRDSDDRLRDIGDARIELRDALAGGAEDNGLTATARGRPVMRILPWSAAALMLAVVIFMMAGPFFGQQSAQPHSTAWTISIPPTSRVAIRGIGGKYEYSRLVAISGDGTIALTVRDSDDRVNLHIKRPADAAPRAVPGTEGARAPFFSRDGARLGFFAFNTLYTVSLAGGAPQPVCEIAPSGNFDAAWSPDDQTIVFATDTGLWRVRAEGGTPEQLTKPRAAAGEIGHHMPAFGPDGKTILFTVAATPETHVAMLVPDEADWKIIARTATQGRLIDAGRLLFARSGEVLLADFDAVRNEISGQPRSVLQNVYTTAGVGGIVLTHYEVSDNGALAYVPDTATREDDALLWVEPGVDGQPSETVITSGPGTWVHPRLSPDGARVSVDIHSADGMRDLYIHDLVRGHRSRLTHNGVTWESEWSPDGRTLAIMSAQEAGRWGVFVVPTDFSGPQRQIARGPHQIPLGWSRDGQSILYQEWGFEQDIWTTPSDGSGEPQRLLASDRHERFARLSPEENWIAYVADESESREVFVRPHPSLSPRYRVSMNGGGEPVWSRDGTTLYYREDDRLMAVDVLPGSEFRMSDPRVVLQGDYDSADAGHQHYDIAIDGERFLMIRPGSVTGPSEVRVTLDWLQTLDH